MSEPELFAKREKVGQFVGVGCLIQGLGLLAPFILGAIAGIPGAVIGIVLLVILFIVGSAKAKSWRCGNCKNPVAGAEVQVCPVCKARLG